MINPVKITIINSVFFFLMLLSMNVKSEVQDLYSKGMHVVITGVGGGATSAIYGGAGAAVIIDGEVLLFDAGPKTKEHLMRSSVLPNYKVDHLFFTHLHVDHTSDLVYMSGWPGLVFDKGYQLYGPVSTKALMAAAFDFNSLHYEEMDALVVKFPSMASIVSVKNFRSPPVNELNSKGGVVLSTGNIKVTAVPTDHMMSENGYSFAYRVDSKYGSVVISGDTVPSLGVIELAKDADLLVHEAIHEKIDPELFIRLGESAKKLSTNGKTIHTSSTEVGKVAQKAGVKKLVTYHYQDDDLAVGAGCQANSYGNEYLKWNNKFIETIRRDYDGEITIGAPCMVFTVSK